MEANEQVQRYIPAEFSEQSEVELEKTRLEVSGKSVSDTIGTLIKSTAAVIVAVIITNK